MIFLHRVVFFGGTGGRDTIFRVKRIFSGLKNFCQTPFMLCMCICVDDVHTGICVCGGDENAFECDFRVFTHTCIASSQFLVSICRHTLSITYRYAYIHTTVFTTNENRKNERMRMRERKRVNRMKLHLLEARCSYIDIGAKLSDLTEATRVSIQTQTPEYKLQLLTVWQTVVAVE